MGWSNYKHYQDDWYDDDRGGNDEYYVTYCPYCDKRAEHDACTDKCVNCED